MENHLAVNSGKIAGMPELGCLSPHPDRDRSTTSHRIGIPVPASDPPPFRHNRHWACRAPPLLTNASSLPACC